MADAYGVVPTTGEEPDGAAVVFFALEHPCAARISPYHVHQTAPITSYPSCAFALASGGKAGKACRSWAP